VAARIVARAVDPEAAVVPEPGGAADADVEADADAGTDVGLVVDAGVVAGVGTGVVAGEVAGVVAGLVSGVVAGVLTGVAVPAVVVAASIGAAVAGPDSPPSTWVFTRAAAVPATSTPLTDRIMATREFMGFDGTEPMSRARAPNIQETSKIAPGSS